MASTISPQATIPQTTISPQVTIPQDTIPQTTISPPSQDTIPQTPISPQVTTPHVTTPQTTIKPQVTIFPSGYFGSSTSSDSSTSTSVPGVSSSQGRMSILTYELVDDTSPLIQYTGIWFGINNQSGTGSFGSPLGNTLHGSNGNGSFTFSFSGTAIRVFGSGKTNLTADYPTWNCSLDGNLFTTNAGPISATNNWALCDSQFSDGTHSFTFSVNVQNEDTTWFDHIQYIPSAKDLDSLNNSTALVDSSDTSVIQYSPGWSWYNQPTSIVQNFGSTHYVHSTGSYFTFWFIGTRFDIYGFMSLYLEGVEIPAAEATCTIDNLTPAPFPVGNSSLVNAPGMLLFSSGELAPGNHTALITYLGNGSTAPLTLSYIVLNALPNFSSSSSTTIHRKPVINGVMVLVLISLLLNIWQSPML